MQNNRFLHFERVLFEIRRANRFFIRMVQICIEYIYDFNEKNLSIPF